MKYAQMQYVFPLQTSLKIFSASLSAILTCIVLPLVASWMQSHCLCYAYRMILKYGKTFYNAFSNFITPKLQFSNFIVTKCFKLQKIHISSSLQSSYCNTVAV